MIRFRKTAGNGFALPIIPNRFKHRGHFPSTYRNKVVTFIELDAIMYSVEKGEVITESPDRSPRCVDRPSPPWATQRNNLIFTVRSLSLAGDLLTPRAGVAVVKRKLSQVIPPAKEQKLSRYLHLFTTLRDTHGRSIDGGNSRMLAG